MVALMASSLLYRASARMTSNRADHVGAGKHRARQIVRFERIFKRGRAAARDDLVE
jgi:hypothetical protein